MQDYWPIFVETSVPVSIFENRGGNSLSGTLLKIAYCTTVKESSKNFIQIKRT